MKGGVQFIGGQALLSGIVVDKQEEITEKNLDGSVKTSTISFFSVLKKREQRGTEQKIIATASQFGGGDV